MVGEKRCFTSDSVSVVITFHDLWTQIVYRVGDIETIRSVKGLVSRTQPSSVPAEYLWSDSCESGVVQIVAAVDKRKAEVNVVLSAED